jgi:hypothetical protein
LACVEGNEGKRKETKGGEDERGWEEGKGREKKVK